MKRCEFRGARVRKELEKLNFHSDLEISLSELAHRLFLYCLWPKRISRNTTMANVTSILYPETAVFLTQSEK